MSPQAVRNVHNLLLAISVGLLVGAAVLRFGGLV